MFNLFPIQILTNYEKCSCENVCLSVVFFLFCLWNGFIVPFPTAAWSENSPSTPEKSSPVMEKQSTPVTPTSTESIKKPEEEIVESTPVAPVAAIAPVAPVVNGNGTHKQPENNNQKVEELYDIPVGTYFDIKKVTFSKSNNI